MPPVGGGGALACAVPGVLCNGSSWHVGLLTLQRHGGSGLGGEELFSVFLLINEK